MIPLIVLVISFAIFRLAGLEIAYFADWQRALRAAIGVMFLFTSSAHWGSRRPDLIRMVPSFLGNGGMWVTLTGVAEILIALGLQIPRAAVAVATLAAALLICIFPANAKAAREHLTIGRRPVPRLGVRLTIQLVFLAALGAAMWPR